MQALQGATNSIKNTSGQDKLNQLEERIDHQVATAEALAQLESGALDTQFDQLDNDVAVDAELAELKRSLGL
jgi:phage shock protein A